MSSMLEQAIIDAAALREAALKNAEQALIEKYAPQIKEAVESMLEGEQRQASYGGRTVSVIHEADEDGMVTVSEDNGKPFTVNESELSELIQEEEEAAPAGVPSPTLRGQLSKCRHRFHQMLLNRRHLDLVVDGSGIALQLCRQPTADDRHRDE